ncbi:ABC transporter ATP-binding protein [Pseudomonas nitroreducens]|uniref:ABC transporter ATP-binding protein n=1 Tax=Pseudomonas nitroreducens TaxID=46680 RepID=UPI0020A1896C|nr:sn-glycerol-3-phosphate ABC transporter ATP-binding protein UgpC [Pseudomonas nitroreducens]MCP1623642.1 multiple sugar transport system ATP-binding protein [Pseudomonas nitroreducens]
MATLQIDGVSKSYGDLDILKRVDIAIEPGDFLVLLGPSGCGKSTLLNLIAGLDDISAGEIRIAGQRVNELSPRDRDIAMVFQSYALYPTMSVRENIEFGMKIRKVPAAERAEAVKRVAALLQIEPLLERKPSQLSGGQRQRVAMGRALVRNPKLFLFDEPLSNLDAKLRVDMRTEIKKLHQRLGTTIVYVTHDQIEAMTMATKVAVMKDGYVQQLADPETIYDTPASVYVARFVGSPAMNIIPASFRLTDRGPQLLFRKPDGGTVSLGDVRISDETARQYSGRDVLVGIRPETFRSVTAGQPDAFDVDVEVIEPTGPDTLAFFTLGGTEVIARLEPRSVQSGRSACLSVNMEKVVLFDRDSEKRIQ